MHRILIVAGLIFACNPILAFFSGSSSVTSQTQRRRVPYTGPIGRKGTQWGKSHNTQEPIELPCDGGTEITRACDTFCKTIGAAYGSCVLKELTCGCSGLAPSPASPVSPQAPPTSGIHVLPAPDLTNETERNVTRSGEELLSTSTVATRNKRMRREIYEKLVTASGSRNSPNDCTHDSCTAICVAKGYETCDAECVGRSCYCRCPDVDKIHQSPSADPLQVYQERNPDLEMNNAFLPPYFNRHQ